MHLCYTGGMFLCQRYADHRPFTCKISELDRQLAASDSNYNTNLHPFSWLGRTTSATPRLPCDRRPRVAEDHHIFSIHQS